MTVQASYLVDVSGLSFTEENADASWVHALPLGSYKHPQYGTIDITVDRAKRFAESVVKKVRGIDASINYVHDNNNVAAGWVKNAEARSDGVWLFVEWIKDAAEAIRQKKWRYFSSEFADEWEDPQTHVKHKDVMFGGALTNRPYIKNLVPVNLSEESVEIAFDLVSSITGKDVDSLKGGNSMGLSDDDIDKVVTKLAEKLGAAKVTDPAIKKLTDIPELKELAEENPMVAALIKHVESQNSNLVESAKELREAKIERQLAEFDRSKIILTPSARKRAAALMEQMPDELSEEFWNLLKDMKKGSSFLVELGERAGATVNYGSPKSAVKLFEELAAKLKTENKLSDADSYERAAQVNPDLYNSYRKELMEGAVN